MKINKNWYVLAGAAMMLVVVMALGVFYYSAKADKAEARITAEQAKQISLNDAGVNLEDVTFTKAKLDVESGIPVYEISFYTEDRNYEYEINGQTGIVREREVLVQKRSNRSTTETENEGNPPPEVPGESWGNDGDRGNAEESNTVDSNTIESNTSAMSSEAKDVIGVTRAQEIALESAGLTAEQVVFLRTSLDTENGTMVYEVKFSLDGREYEYTIDAWQGVILEEELELPEEEVPEETESSSSGQERQKQTTREQKDPPRTTEPETKKKQEKKKSDDVDDDDDEEDDDKDEDDDDEDDDDD